VIIVRDAELEYIEHIKEAPMRLIIVSLEASGPHWHEEFEVVFVLRGAVTVCTERGTFTPRGGDVMLINPREMHSFRRSADGNICLILQFSHSVISEVYGRSFAFQLNTTDEPLISQDTARLMRRTLADMGLMLHHRPDGYQFTIKSDLYGFIGIMFRSLRYTMSEQSDSGQSAEYLSDFDLIKQFIKQHYKEDVDQTRIGHELGMSRAKVYRVLKAAGSASTKDMTNYYRVEHSKHLLRSTDQNISFIAQESGFESESSFYRVFHEFSGMPPLEYRKIPAKKPELTGIQGYAQYSVSESLSLLKQFAGN
jgi:AraC-like DNA-binding protein/quercetin dioxygenase-like cupin family protein